MYHVRCLDAGQLPETVTLTVADGGVFLKGDTAASQLKPCTLENGTTVMVPPYVQSGHHIVVDTRDGSFVRRLI